MSVTESARASRLDAMLLPVSAMKLGAVVVGFAQTGP